MRVTVHVCVSELEAIVWAQWTASPGNFSQLALLAPQHVCAQLVPCDVCVHVTTLLT